VFLLDEPISHLDAKIRAELRSQFHNLEALREVSTVYVTHDYAEALSLGDRIGVMGNGGLMQIGSANEIYDKPNSLFVAQHLGQPGINSFEAELASEGDSYFAFAGEFKLPIAEEDGKILMGKKISKCHLGIRPQYIQLEVGSKKIETETTVFQGNVDVFEALGSYGVMMVSILGESFTLLTDPEDRYQHNDKVSLKFDPKTFHFFDINSGQNLI
jgi:ABC-type sugar transport system ATPase subunit